MGKLKDLITDKTFELVETFKTEVPGKKGRVKVEEAYTYVCKETGAKVTFCAHPTEAFNWFIVLSHTNDLGQLVAPTVLEKFVETCMDGSGVPQKLEL